MNKEKSKEEIYKVLRSLIISCNPRDGLSLSRLLGDFHEFEGITLPLFEHRNAVEFLRASGEFDIDNFGGGYIIYAKTSRKSQHIAKLVAEQNGPRANRAQFSVQNRISTGYRTTHSAGNSQQFEQKISIPPSLQRAAPTVEFSFEQLKKQQKEKTNSESNQPNQLIISSQDRVQDGGNFIDLHREHVKQMSDDIAVPGLITMKLTAVKISHISDNGDIFIHLKQSGVDYVQKLITQFIRKVSNNPILPLKKVVPISNENLFVVHDLETKKQYRAKVLNEMDGGCNMFFIDYGHSKFITSSKIYPIETGYRKEEIYRYPPQAIRIKLSDVNESAIQSLVQRLRSHFILKRNAYVRKIQSDAIVPEVKLYFDAESFMVCVNDSLKWENERSQMITGTRNDDEHDVSDASHASDTSDILCNAHSIVDRTIVEKSISIETPKIETFLPPKLNCCFEIEIVKVESPSNFVIKPTEHTHQWQKQMKTLQAYCKEPSATITLDMIREGEPYACLKSNGFWYRAFIKFHRTKAYAFFCDVSDIEEIDVRKIRFLPKQYRIIPQLAMTARLFGVKPVNGTWEMDDNVQFNRMTKGKKFLAEVIKVNDINSEEIVLEIILKFESIVINELFTTSGRATSDVNGNL